jgi:hypothetical protein
MYFMVKKTVFFHWFTGEMATGTNVLNIREALKAGHDEDLSNGIIQSWYEGWDDAAWHDFVIIDIGSFLLL